MEYKKLLIQQQTFDGETYTDVGSVIDTQSSFHVVCQEFPYMQYPEAKELARHDWYDEDGEDVWIPSDGIKFKPYDLEATFIYLLDSGSIGNASAEETMRTDIKNFIDFLYGKNNGGSPLLAVYDEYTQTGRRGVYVLSVRNELYWLNDGDPDKIAQFKVKFRVTDPVTSVTLTTNANTQ